MTSSEISDVVERATRIILGEWDRRIAQQIATRPEAHCQAFAEALSGAGLLGDLAAVWDEGYAVGEADEFDAREGNEHDETPNPYQSQVEAG